MDRRDFLQTGAAATLVGAVGTTVGSCAATQNVASLLDGSIEFPDMNSYLKEIDEGIAKIATWDFDGILTGGGGEPDQNLDLARRSLEALYMTAMFSDQSEVGQAHPGMQKRILDASLRMDDTIAEMGEFLNTRTSSQLADVQVALSENPDLPMEVAEMLNQYGKEFGLGPSRRIQVRGMVSQTALRMKAQSPSLVVDEYVNKVKKLVKRSGSAEEIKQQIIARMGEQEFFEKHERMTLYAKAWETQGQHAEATASDAGPAQDTGEETFEENADAGISDESAPKIQAAEEPHVAKTAHHCAGCKEPLARLKKGEKLVRGGAWTLGIGVVIGLIGVAVMSSAILASAVMWTVGGILLIVGLIILIVGVVKKNSAQRELDEKHS